MPTKEEYDRRKTDQKTAQEKKRSERWRVQAKQPLIVFTGVLAICTFLLVLVGVLQKCTLDAQRIALENTDRTLKNTLIANIREQRAFIFRTKYKITPQLDGGAVIKWNVTPVLKNSGHVPTKTLRYYFDNKIGDFIFDTPIICPADFPTIIENQKNQIFHPRSLGAQQDDEDDAGSVWTATPQEINALTYKHRFVFGIIEYTDELTWPTEHQTRFCDGLMLFGNPSTSLTYSVLPTTDGNCFDAECERQDRERKK